MLSQYTIELLHREEEIDMFQGTTPSYTSIGKRRVHLKIRIPSETAGLKNREGLDAREGTLLSKTPINAQYIYSPDYKLIFEIIEPNINSKRYLYHVRGVQFDGIIRRN